MIPKASNLAAALGVKPGPASPRKEDPLRRDHQLLNPPVKKRDSRTPLSYLRVHTNGNP